MSQTRLQLVNGVLERLRETTVSAVSDNAYSKLIGKWVNDAKREVEDKSDWTSLRSGKSVVTVVDQIQYAITGTSKRSRILRFPMPRHIWTGGWVDGWNDTHDSPLWRMDRGSFETLRFMGNTQASNPIYFTEAGWNASDELLIDLWPTPSAIDTLRFIVLVPQAPLSADGDLLTVPDDAVELLAYAKAVRERGEDAGESAAVAYEEARVELARQISFDMMRAIYETDWHVV